MPKVLGNNRSSALKRLSNPYSTTKIDRRPVVGGNSSSISDARQILVNRNQTSFDARQLLSRQTSKNDDNDDKMIVITGLKDVKMKDGRVKKKRFNRFRNIVWTFFQLVPTSTVSGASTEKKKAIYTVGTSTMVTIRNSNGNNTSSTQPTDKITLTKVSLLYVKGKSIFRVSFRQLRTHLSVVMLLLLLHPLHRTKKFSSVLSTINMRKIPLRLHQLNRHRLHLSIIVIHHQ